MAWAHLDFPDRTIDVVEHHGGHPCEPVGCDLEELCSPTVVRTEACIQVLPRTRPDTADGREAYAAECERRAEVRKHDLAGESTAVHLGDATTGVAVALGAAGSSRKLSRHASTT